MPEKDATTVRSLVTNVTDLARHLEMSPNGIYRWIKLNRIPASKLLKVAGYYDIDVPFHLGYSEKTGAKPLKHKPRDTLPICIRVQAGEMSIEEAARRLGLHERAIKLILTNWGDDLPKLYQTLQDLDQKLISLDQAAANLGVSKYNVHALRQKYGFRPPPRSKAKERPIVQRRQTAKAVALDCIAGKISLNDVEKVCSLSWRTIHRKIAEISPDWSLISLTHWPKSFRQAYAVEIERNLPKMSEKLWKFAETSDISLKKWPKYPETPQKWREIPLKRMMIHILLGDETLETVAQQRGADPSILQQLFTGDLRMIGLTWEQVTNAPLESQIALAELLIAIEDNAKTPRQRMLERLKKEEA